MTESNLSEHAAVVEAANKCVVYCDYAGQSNVFAAIIAAAAAKVCREEKIKAYHQGFRDGLREFAWWNNGFQYVGTCGKTLKDAIAEVDAGERIALNLNPNEVSK
jgi:hypothetical protein